MKTKKRIEPGYSRPALASYDAIARYLSTHSRQTRWTSMPVITDNNTLKTWLTDSPPEFACVLASRAALRVAPLLVEALHDDITTRRATVLLPCFRTLSTAHFASAFPMRVSEIRDDASAVAKVAGNAISEVADSAQISVIETTEAVPEDHFLIHKIELDARALRVAEYAVHAAVHAVQAAIDTVDATNGIASPQAAFESATETIGTALNAVDGAHGYPQLLGNLEADSDTEIESTNHITKFWKAVELDAELLEAGEGAIGNIVESVADISSRALWLDDLPVWAGRKWTGFRDELPENEGWNVWMDWYEARLTGESSDGRMEFALVTIPKEDWAQGPTHANDIIAKLVETKPDPLVTAFAFGSEDQNAVNDVIDLEMYSTRIRDALPDDPMLAIGTAKEMLEATMRTILQRRGMDKKKVDDFNFPDLTDRCFSELGLAIKSLPATESDSENYLRTIASSAKEMVIASNRLRNRVGTGHGRVVGAEPMITEAEARLVASIGFILTAWLARHHSKIKD